MHIRNYYFKYLVFLFVLFSFFVFVNNSYSVEDCGFSTLGNLSNGATLNLTSDFSCNLGQNLSNYSSLVFNCNNYIISAGSGSDFILNDSSITFVNCNFNFTGNYIDNVNTTIFYNDSNISNINFLNTVGEHLIYRNISFNLQNEYGDNLSNYGLNVSSLAYSFFTQADNLKSKLIETENYTGGVLNDRNNFNISASSDYYLSNNFTIQNLSANLIVNLVLFDLRIPAINYTIINDVTNESLNLTGVFNKPVNGTLNLYNSSYNLVKNVSFSSFLNNYSIFSNSLFPASIYYLGFNVSDIHALSNNSILSILYQTYSSLGIITNSYDSFEYSGNPQSTTSFNFSSSLYNIFVEFLEPVNLSGVVNLSQNISIINNSIFIDSNSRFNKMARLYFNNLPYQKTPLILKNGIFCSISNCSIESYNSLSGDLIFNVTGFSNYSTISNSNLSINYSFSLSGNNTFFIYANYSNILNNSPINVSSSCDFEWQGINYSMNYNSSSKLYFYSKSYNNFGDFNYSIFCNSTNYDDKNLKSNITLVDLTVPRVVSTQVLTTNSSLNITAFFNKPVNGTLNIYNSSYSLIKNVTFSSLVNNYSIFANNLNARTYYYFGFNLTDASDNVNNSIYDLYKTYINVNIFTDIFDVLEYSGNPESTTSLNFSSLSKNIYIEFLEPINLSGVVDIYDYILILTNSVYVNSSSPFDKKARLYFNELNYRTTPVVLKNDTVCKSNICGVESFNAFNGNFVFNVTGFSYHYSTISNSNLSSNYSFIYPNQNIFTVYANYSKLYDNSAIIGALCKFEWGGVNYTMSYDSSTKFYKYSKSYNNFGDFNYSIFCNSTNYEFISLDSNITLSDILDVGVATIDPIIDNESILLNITFTKIVNGTLNFYDSGYSLIKSNSLSNLNNTVFFIDNLTPKTQYYFRANLSDSTSSNLSVFYPYKTYISLNITSGITDNFSYLGNPQSTTNFTFWSNLYNITVDYLEPLNLSNNFNLSEEIVIGDNFIYINSSSRFNKRANLIFDNLNYQTTPAILKNGEFCLPGTCDVILYNQTIGRLIFNVSGFSNYSTTSNSNLVVNSSLVYRGLETFIYANYSKIIDNSPITTNATCQISFNSQNHNMNYNSSSKLYFYNKTFSLSTSYSITCSALDYDSKIFSSTLNILPTPIDDFTVTRTIIKKDLSNYLTENKILNVTIVSNGTNNVADYFDTTYSFMISRDLPFNNSNWNNLNSVTSWVNVGKNENFSLYNLGKNNTIISLGNGTIFNHSQFIFIDEDLSSFYVNIKACNVDGCKYNSSIYYIFTDTSSPEFYNKTTFIKYLSSKTNQNFSFYLRDLESGIKDVYYGIGRSNSPLITTPNQILNFNNNEKTDVIATGFNFLEGFFYKIRIGSSSNKESTTPSYNLSDQFLIDTIAPNNFSFDIFELYDNIYVDRLNFTLNYSIEDYNFNYTLENKNASGIDYMQIFYRNGSLSEGICGDLSSQQYMLNLSLNQTSTPYVFNLSYVGCYNLSFKIFDKVGNFNYSYFNRTIKIDNTKPVIVSALTEFPYNRVEKSIFELNQNPLLYTLSWDIIDLETNISSYELKVFDNTTSEYVYNVTINTPSLTSYDVYYNSSYFIDGHSYINYVRAKNNAGVYSSFSVTDGITFFVKKIPYLKTNNTLNIFYNFSYPNSSKYRILNPTNKTLYNLSVYDLNGFNITCKWYNYDTSYSDLAGNLCFNSNTPSPICELDLSLNSSFYVSCKNDDLINSKNNATNNLDIIEIISEPNYLPLINTINGINNNYNITVFENESLNLSFAFSDNNSYDLVLGDFSLDWNNLIINVSDLESNLDVLNISFIREPYIDQPRLLKERIGNGEYYSFKFNDSINYSQIISLNSNLVGSGLAIFSDNLSKSINYSTSFIYGNENYFKNYTGGVSNIVSIVYLNSSGYNFTFNDTHVFWNLENNTIRNVDFNITVYYSDKVNLSSKNITIYVRPNYLSPSINYTYLNLYNNISINQYQIYTLDISGYFYENNTQVGLYDILDNSILNYTNLEVLDFDANTGVAKLINLNGQNSTLRLVSENYNNMKTFLDINFNVSSVVDNVSPVLNIRSPLNNSNLLLSKLYIPIAINSSEDLYYIDFYLNGFKYDLCDNICQNYSSNVSIFDFIYGQNNLTFEISDFAGNINSTNLIINFSLDSDLDTIPNILDDDSDGDGVNNSLDKINYVNNSINSNLNYSVLVNSSINMSINYSSSMLVEFKNSNYTYLEFDFDFNLSNLDLLETQFFYDSSKRSAVVRNLNITSNKTLYIPKSENNYFYVCIRDEEGLYLDSISSRCNGANEYLLNCDSGQSNSGFSCSNVTQSSTDFYKITGLTHSGVKLVCVEDWSYGSWSSCVSNSQSRTGIVDNNACGTTYNKVQTQSCTSPVSPPSGGGSSGGSGGGGSSGSSVGGSSGGGYYIPPVVVITDNQTQVENNDSDNNVDNSNQNPVILPISLGNFNYDIFNKKIENATLYSFNFNNVIYEGRFIIDGENLVFDTTSGDLFNLILGENKLDLDNDVIDDILINLTKQSNGDIYLSSKSLVENIQNDAQVNNPNNVVDNSFGQNNVDESSSSGIGIGVIFFIIFGIVVIVCVVGFVLYKKGIIFKTNINTNLNSDLDFYLKNKSESVVENYPVQNNTSEVENKVLVTEDMINEDFENILIGYDDLLDKAEEYSNMLKNVVYNEDVLFDDLKREVRDLVNRGYSWVDIFYFMKKLGVLKYFIKKIINISYLVSNLERVHFEYKFDDLDKDEIKEILLEQEWFSQFYIYRGDGSIILNHLIDVIYNFRFEGFSKFRINKFFLTEFEYGIENTKADDVMNLDSKLSSSNIKSLIIFQDNLLSLRKQIVDLHKKVKFSNLEMDEFMELDFILKNLIHSIDKHLN